jgi:hypothetical protein
MCASERKRTNEIFGTKKMLKQNDCYKEEEGSNHELWYSPKNNKTFPVGRQYRHEGVA